MNELLSALKDIVHELQLLRGPRQPVVTIPVTFRVATSGTHSLWTNNTGQKQGIYELWAWNVAEQTLEMRSDNRTLTERAVTFPEKSAWWLPDVGAPHFELHPGERLQIVLSASTEVAGFVNIKAI